jgi:hypothetical protein
MKALEKLSKEEREELAREIVENLPRTLYVPKEHTNEFAVGYACGIQDCSIAIEKFIGAKP